MSEPTWIRVSAKLPEVGEKVLVCGHWDNGNKWTALAKWHPAGSIDCSTWDEVPDDWVDDTNPHDEWMEEPIESEQSFSLRNVTHWMTLPDKPTN
jgi:hypothetical protein